MECSRRCLVVVMAAVSMLPVGLHGSAGSVQASLGPADPARIPILGDPDHGDGYGTLKLDLDMFNDRTGGDPGDMTPIVENFYKEGMRDVDDRSHVGAGPARCSMLVNCPEPYAEVAGNRKLFFEGSNFKLITHVVGSHAQAVTRPVTSAKRLFYLVYDTFKDTVGSLGRVEQRKTSPLPELSDKGTMDLQAWEERLDRITGRLSSRGTLDFLVDGEEFFPRFLGALGDAKQSVNIRTYIFDNDDYAVKVADALKDRSREIDIKVLMDGLGTIVATGVDPDTMPTGFDKPGSVREYLTVDSGIRVRQQGNPWLAGDHTKTITIDGRTAFIGGMNIGREYRYEWHDLMVEVRGPAAARLNRDFEKAWAGGGFFGDLESFFHLFKKNRGDDDGEGYPLRVLYSRPGDSEIRRAQLEAIRRSRGYIYLQNPYFTDDAVLHELVNARHRGVDVRVILPAKVDNSTIGRSNVLAANRMLENGIKVYILPHHTHVKAAVYDGWACFGSANFDKLSLRVNYETDVATSEPEAVKTLVHRLFIPDFMAADELTEKLPVRPSDPLMELLADHL